MKYLVIIGLSILVFQSFEIVIKKETSFISRAQITTRGVNLQGYSYSLFLSNSNCKGYPEEILKELNLFRRKNHYFPFIRWHNPLAGTGFNNFKLVLIQIAGREAQSIIAKKSFGQHQNFHDWRKQVNGKYFTELALKVDTEGMMPPKRIFAKDQNKNRNGTQYIHGYTHGGVAVMPTNKPHKFIVVIHLMRTPSKFHSCKEAAGYGSSQNKMAIFIKGKKVDVVCDQKTVGGGWTRVLDRGVQTFGVVNIPINDLELTYTEVLFRAKPNYYFDFAKGGGAMVNCWDFNGFCFPLQAMKFDNVWYFSDPSPTHVAERNAVPHQYYNKDDKNVLQVLKGAEKCYFSTNNKPEYCAKEFIWKKLPKGRLNAFSDVESIANKWAEDNQFDQHFEIFVR